MRRRATSLGIFLIATVFLPSCSQSVCTLIGCGSSLSIDFTGATETAGRYRVDMVADGVPSSCEVTVPAGGQATCSVAQLPWRIMTQHFKDDGSVRLRGLEFWSGAPTSIDFVVYRDDVVVGGESAQPVYTESQPNGPECGPVCRHTPHVEAELAP